MKVTKKWKYIIAGGVVIGLIVFATRRLGVMGFASKDSQYPSDKEIGQMIKKHKIGNPSKDYYDVQGPFSSGKHKGDVEITDLGPHDPSSRPSKPHKKPRNNSIYPGGGGGPSNKDCCAMLQQMMGGGGGGPPPMMGGGGGGPPMGGGGGGMPSFPGGGGGGDMM